MDPPSVSPAALLCRVEALLLRGTGATKVEAFLVNRWFHKLFHCSAASANNDGKAAAVDQAQSPQLGFQGQQQLQNESKFNTRAVCDLDEGLAGMAAMTGRKLRVRDCIGKQRSLCGPDHDRGSLVCWPIQRRPCLAWGDVVALPPAARDPPATEVEDVDGTDGTAVVDGCGGGRGGGGGDAFGQSSSDVLAVLQLYCADGELSAEAMGVLWDVGRLLVPLLTDAVALEEEHMHRRSAEALFSLSQIVPREMGLIEMVGKVVAVAERLTQAERVCLFFVDDVADELWVAKSVDFDDAKIKIGHGLCGHAAATGGTVNVINCYEDSRFDSRWDKQTGFVTKRCVCMCV